MDPADLALVDAFVHYLRRQLGGGEADVVHVSKPARAVPARAAIVVDTGAGGWRRTALRLRGLRPQFSGVARGAGGSSGVPVTIWDRWDRHRVGEPPAGFEVMAIMTTYNEAGIIDQQLDRMTAAGLHVHMIDNWSTDDTWERAKAKAAHAPITLERWPENGPSRYFSLRGLLTKVEQVAHTCGADWVIHHDADEIHESPWPDTDMRHALWALEQWGFNAADHTGVDFRPVDNRWGSGDDLATSFEWFEFPPIPAYFTLVRCWKPQPSPVDLANAGGHDAVFEGRRMFPYKFLIRHYPIRSQAHGERKILRERKARFDPAERAKGWHVHYDHFDEGSSFLWDPSGLHRWEEIDERYLLQRLSGAGLPGNPRPDEAGPAAAAAVAAGAPAAPGPPPAGGVR